MADPEQRQAGLPQTDPHAANLTPAEHRVWQDPESTGRPFGQFMLGVLAGNGAIVLGLLLTAAYFPRSNVPYPFFAALGGEAVLGLVLVIASRGWRPLGIGLIAAAPIGAMLFFVGCFLILKAT